MGNCLGKKQGEEAVYALQPRFSRKDAVMLESLGRSRKSMASSFQYLHTSHRQLGGSQLEGSEGKGGSNDGTSTLRSSQSTLQPNQTSAVEGDRLLTKPRFSVQPVSQIGSNRSNSSVKFSSVPDATTTLDLAVSFAASQGNLASDESMGKPRKHSRVSSILKTGLSIDTPDSSGGPDGQAPSPPTGVADSAVRLSINPNPRTSLAPNANRASQLNQGILQPNPRTSTASGRASLSRPRGSIAIALSLANRGSVMGAKELKDLGEELNREKKEDEHRKSQIQALARDALDNDDEALIEAFHAEGGMEDYLETQVDSKVVNKQTSTHETWIDHASDHSDPPVEPIGEAAHSEDEVVATAAENNREPTAADSNRQPVVRSNSRHSPDDDNTAAAADTGTGVRDADNRTRDGVPGENVGDRGTGDTGTAAGASGGVSGAGEHSPDGTRASLDSVNSFGSAESLDCSRENARSNLEDCGVDEGDEDSKAKEEEGQPRPQPKKVNAASKAWASRRTTTPETLSAMADMAEEMTDLDKNTLLNAKTDFVESLPPAPTPLGASMLEFSTGSIMSEDSPLTVKQAIVSDRATVQPIERTPAGPAKGSTSSGSATSATTGGSASMSLDDALNVSADTKAKAMLNQPKSGLLKKTLKKTGTFSSLNKQKMRVTVSKEESVKNIDVVCKTETERLDKAQDIFASLARALEEPILLKSQTSLHSSLQSSMGSRASGGSAATQDKPSATE